MKAYEKGRADALAGKRNSNPYPKRVADDKRREWYEYNKGYNDVAIEKMAQYELPL